MNPFLELPAVEEIYITEPGGLFSRPKTKTQRLDYTARVLPGEITATKKGKYGTVLLLRHGHKIETTLNQETIDMARQTYDVVMRKNPGRTENLVMVSTSETGPDVHPLKPVPENN